MNNNTLEKFLIEYILPKTGTNPFLNITDVRNRRKIAEAIGESLSDININLSENELTQILDNIINFQNLKSLKDKPLEKELDGIQDLNTLKETEVEESESESDGIQDLNTLKETEVEESESELEETKEVTNEEKSE